MPRDLGVLTGFFQPVHVLQFRHTPAYSGSPIRTS
jgi:hypothetical protein